MQVVFNPLATLEPAVGDLLFQVRHDLFNGGTNRVISALRQQVWAGGDQVDVDAESRTRFLLVFQAHVGLLNLETWLQRDNAVLDEGIHGVGGPDVDMLDVQSRSCRLFCSPGCGHRLHPEPAPA